jgi:hypothetical protein
MLKGHAQIELSDVHTGKKQVLESDNMFTDAISTLLNRRGIVNGGSNSTSTFYLPLQEKALRGILLFPVALEENASMIYPKTAFIAHAGNDTGVGTDASKGAYNETESGAITNGYRYVWDFTTSQGNGTIACLCLTSNIFGNECMKSNTSTFFNDLDTYCTQLPHPSLQTGEPEFAHNIYRGCVIGGGTDYALYAIPSYSADNKYNFGSLTLLKIHHSTAGVSLSTSHTPVIELVKQINFTEHSTVYGFNFFYNNLVYCVCYIDATSICLYKINVENETIEKDIVSVTDAPSTFYDYNSFNKNGYLYFLQGAGDTKTLVKMNLANYTDITPIIETSARWPSLRYFEKSKTARIAEAGIVFEDDTVYLDSNTDGFDANSYYSNDTGEILTNGLYSLMIASHDTSSVNYIAAEQTLYAGYLATINNLPSPVTKTAEQTMKITYTVTES